MNATTTEHFLTNVTTTSHPGTTAASVHHYSTEIGFVAAFVSALFFGSNFLPVKKYNMGDGMFFQWIMCTAIWTIGVIIYWIRNFPQFYALAMLGGAMWATGNVCVVPILSTIGLGLGFLIWATFNMFSGWWSGRFGMFGLLKPQIPGNISLNWAGFIVCAVSVIFYVSIKPTIEDTRSEHSDSNTLSETTPINSSDQQRSETLLDNLSLIQKRILGTCLAIFAGLLFGLSFAPIIHIQNFYPNSSQNGLDYVFAHFTGILAASTLYFAIYCAALRNNPILLRPIVLPSLLSGLMWAIADGAWFIANDGLSEAVSFPIVTAVPGALNAFWGVFLFKEIQGRRNYLILAVALTFTAIGVTLTALSKKQL